MPIALALTGGFIQSAISPTVLVTGMLELQRRGFGQAKSKLVWLKLPEDIHVQLCILIEPCTGQHAAVSKVTQGQIA